MKVCYVSNTASNSGAPKMLKLIVDWFAKEYKDHHPVLLFPLDSARDIARQTGTVFLDAALTFSQRVELACEILRREKPDLVFVNTLRVAAFAVAARKLGIRNMVYVHEMGDSISRLVQQGFVSIDIAQYTDLMLWASEGARLQWEYFTGGRSKSVVLESCFTTKSLVAIEMASSLNIVSQLSQYPHIIMSVGAICLRKGFDRFVELAQRRPLIPFIWIGSFDNLDPEQAVMLKEMAAAQKNVAITGQLSDPASVLALSSLVLFLSREDPNPLTIHEAVYHGFKFVATIDGLGESRLPLSTGAALAHYDPDLLVDIIDPEFPAIKNTEIVFLN
jgi:glycosyltransferase involved in cell wall biosynthesis